MKAQINLDSLRHVWEDSNRNDQDRFSAFNQFYIWNTNDKPSVSLKVTEAHLALANQSKNLRETIKAFNERGICYGVQGNTDSSLFYMEEAIGIGEQLNDSLLIGKLYANHGNALLSAERLRDAVRRYVQSLSILEQLHAEPYYQADLNNNLGLIYYDLKLYEIAQSYLKKALQLYTEAKGNEAIGNIWLNLGATHFHLGEQEDAKVAVLKSMKMLKEENNLNSLSGAHLMNAAICERYVQMDSARFYSNLAVSERREFGNNGSLLEALMWDLNLSLKNNSEYQQTQRSEIEELLKNEDSKQILADGYRLLHALCKKEGDEARALEALELHCNYADAVKIDKDKITVVREALQSDFDNKMLHKELLEERAKAASETSHLRNILLLILGSLIMIVMVVWIARRRMKQHERQRAELLREIESLKKVESVNQNHHMTLFELNKEKLEGYLNKKLNETDWAILKALLEDPVISNKDLASRVFLSPDGVGSALRRMYSMFDIPESKYMKIGLLLQAVKISNSGQNGARDLNFTSNNSAFHAQA